MQRALTIDAGAVSRLFADGGRYSAHDVALACNAHTRAAVALLARMERHGEIKKVRRYHAGDLPIFEAVK